MFKSEWITTREFKDVLPVRTLFPASENKTIRESVAVNLHTHFRKKATFEDCENITLRISADDYYKLYINGRFVCQGPAPAYPSVYNYNEVDISPYLTKGENIFAVHLYYNGKINNSYFSQDNRMGLISDVYKNGKFLFGTDESWLYFYAQEFSGETIGYDTQFLENIDFTKEEKGWTELDFCDSHYQHAFLYKGADHKFRKEPAETISVYDKKPVSIKETSAGNFFIDFGEEISGQLYMEATGKKGSKLVIKCGEETEKHNPYEARYELRCNCTYKEICTLSGETDKFNFYDYKTFRYANIESNGASISKESIKAVVRHHKFNEIIKLKTDLPYLSDIWNICKNAVKLGAQGSLLDCPSREKGAYLGDFTVSGLSHYYLTGDKDYFKKNLFDHASTHIVTDGLITVANCGKMQEIADYSLQFPMQILKYYELTKDIDFLKEMYPVVSGIINYFKRYEREDGLLYNVNKQINLVDWPKNLRDDYDAVIEPDEKDPSKPLDCHNVLNAFYTGAHISFDRINEILSIDCKSKTEKLKESFLKAFYDEKTGLFCDNENKTHSALHSNVLPLFFDIATPDMRENLRAFIMKKGFCCGVYFSYFILKSLAKIGAYEDELSLILNESENSWVNMLKEGATTCFEAWGKDKKWNTSLCHPWASSPVIAIVEDLNGKFGIEIDNLN